MGAGIQSGRGLPSTLRSLATEDGQSKTLARWVVACQKAMAMIPAGDRTAISRPVIGLGLDKGAACSDIRVEMKKGALASAKRKINYPEHTEYDRMASKARRRANRLTSEQRAEYLRRGMVKIYGGEWPKETTGAGH